jgi:hypothetical protein
MNFEVFTAAAARERILSGPTPCGAVLANRVTRTSFAAHGDGEQGAEGVGFALANSWCSSQKARDLAHGHAVGPFD